jgi:hypothetical protein
MFGKALGQEELLFQVKPPAKRNYYFRNGSGSYSTHFVAGILFAL